MKELTKKERKCPTCPSICEQLAQATETLYSCCAEVDAQATALYCKKCKVYSVDIRRE